MRRCVFQRLRNLITQAVACRPVRDALKIAQRFNAGTRPSCTQSPVGTNDPARRTILAFWAVLISCSISSFAQAQQVELQIEARTLQEGESVDLTLICTNTGEPGAPQFDAPPGLELRLLNPTPARASMVSLVNGRRSETTTHTFSLRLTGIKAGSYTLAPIVVPAGGSTYQTDSIPITVTRPAVEAQKDGDKLVFARISAQPTSLYITQSVEATLMLAIRKFERDGQPVELGNMLQLVDAAGSDLAGFGTRFNSSEITFADSNGQRHAYLVYRQTREIRAEQAGAMTVGPAFFKVNYPVSLRRSLFGGYEVAQHRRESARAAPIQIEVKAPPAENRPFDFGGAIGQYEFSLTAKPLRVEQGQPVTLAIAIKGDPLDGVAGPDLKLYPELAARFDFSPEESPGEKEGSAKVFRRAIFPRREGEQVIPAISWSYFNPATQQYVTLTSSPIPIVVDPSAAPDTITPSGDEQSAAVTALTKTTGGISPNIVDARRVLIDHELRPPPAVLGAAVALPPALCFAAMLISWRGARMRGDVNFARRRAAARNARTRINRSRSSPASNGHLHELAKALTGFISDRFGLPPGALTPGDAQKIIADRTGDAVLAADVAGFLASCDMARFAGNFSASASPANPQKQAAELIDQIEKAAR